MRAPAIAGFCFALGLLAATAAAAAESALPRSELWIETTGERLRFEVEIPDTLEQFRRGLMFRTELADDAGMLFDYVEPQPVAMWMKNTLIPLDMLFIDENGIVTRIEPWTVPLSTETIWSGESVRAVLELKGGITERLGIAAGDRVVHARFANTIRPLGSEQREGVP